MKCFKRYFSWNDSGALIIPMNIDQMIIESRPFLAAIEDGHRKIVANLPIEMVMVQIVTRGVPIHGGTPYQKIHTSTRTMVVSIASSYGNHHVTVYGYPRPPCLQVFVASSGHATGPVVGEEGPGLHFLWGLVVSDAKTIRKHTKLCSAYLACQLTFFFYPFRDWYAQHCTTGIQAYPNLRILSQT